MSKPRRSVAFVEEQLGNRILQLKADGKRAVSELFDAREKIREVTARAEKAEQELADYKLLVASQVQRLRVILRDGQPLRGMRLILEEIVENLSAPAPAQEGKS